MQSLRPGKLILTFLLLLASITVWSRNYVYNTAQTEVPVVDTGKSNGLPDTSITANDTLSGDSLKPLPFTISPDTLEDQVLYKCSDSSILKLSESKFYLYGDAEVKYQNITLKAAEIVFNWSNNTVTANGRKDSTGKMVDIPEFNDGDQQFDAHRMAYNFKTKKGKIYDLRMQESEGFLHTREAKKNDNDEIFARKVQYTTCDKRNPHYYIEANPSKVIPNELLVTGPANLLIAGVRTPFVLPFALFPLKRETRQSGLILPQIANQQTFGYGLTRGGYYLALSEYFDLSLTGDIYSSGSWGAHVASNFKKRYKYSGNINIDYSRFKQGDVFFEDLSIRKSFKVGGNFRIDPKAWPNNRLNVSLSFGSSGSNNYNRYNETNLDQRFQNTYQSSISYSHQFPANSPFNFQASARYTQDINSGRITLTLPEFSTGLSRVFPFERKDGVKEERWFDPVLEPINFSWNVNSKNQVETSDSTLFSRQTLEDLQFGVSHRIPLSANYKIFKYITFSPSINYNENWYIRSYDRRYEPQLTGDSTFTYVQVDTSSGFNAVRYWSYSANFQTNLYGMLQFKNSKVKAIRHKVTPSIGFNYNPSYTDRYYQSVQINPEGDVNRFATFPNLYSRPPTQEFGGISYGLVNNVEMKVADATDTVDGTKKVTILDRLSFNGRYNFLQDSLQWSQINASGYSNFFNRKLNVNYGFTLDPYALNEQGKRVNTFQWDAKKRPLRFVAANLAMGTSFSAKELEKINIPLNGSVNYQLNMNKGQGSNIDTLILRQSIRTNVSVTPTPNWTIRADLAYDLDRGEVAGMNVNIRRDLHCWYMAFNWVPVGVNKQYTFTIQAKSNLLKDLKVRKRSDRYQNFPEFQ